MAAFATQSVTLSWNASADPTVAGYKIYYGTSSGVYPNSVDAGSATSVTITGLADGSTNYFAGTTYDSSNNESSYSSEIVDIVPGTAASSSTTTSTTTTSTNSALNPVSGVTVTPNPADASSVTVSWSPSTDTAMAGYLVSYGPAGVTPTVVPAWQHTSLVVTGLVMGVTNYIGVEEYDVAWNLGPMPNLATYCYPLPSDSTSGPTNTTSSGTTTGSTNSTSTDTNGVTTTATNTTPVITNTVPTNTNTTVTATNTPPPDTNTIVITVTNIPVVTPPTLDALPAILLNINSATQAVALTGIAPGTATTNQTIKITAVSSKTTLIPNPVISYQSPNSTGTLLLKPKASQTGSATITVTMTVGGSSTNIMKRTFVVTVINFALMPKISRAPTGTATLPGKTVILTVSATGSALKYQWKHNGTNLVGATTATLSLKKVSPAHSGAYTVQVSNSLGVTNSLPAVVTVITNTAPVFSPPVQANGQFSFQVSGVPGGKYVIEASTDLQHWSPVSTNTAPFTFSDQKLAGYDQKFYRGYYAQ
jgi:hypothetical protein